MQVARSAEGGRPWRAAAAGVALFVLVATLRAVPDEAEVERFLAERRARDGIPGLAVAIASQGMVSWVRGYGEAAVGRPMGTNTPIAASSLMKGITAACVLQLVDAGRIVLDQPVQRYLPAFTLADSAGSAGLADSTARITVRQLLNQTSGLADGGFPEMRLPQPASLAERVVSLSAARPASPPGQTFRYPESVTPIPH